MLNIFKEICGAKALENVVLVKTRWDSVDEAIGAKRERELRADFWAYMVSHGSAMTRFHGDRNSAIAIVSQLLNKPSVIFDIQREMVDEKKPLNETKAGSLVNDSIAGLKKIVEAQLKELESLHYSLKENDRKTKKVQKDLELERRRLQTATEEQERLKRKIGNAMSEKIEVEKKNRKRNGLRVVGAVLPTLLSVLGMFLGIPGGDSSAW